MKAAALNDMVQQYQRIFAGKKVANAKYFLAAAEQVREVIDEDTQGASMRRTLFILAGDYHDQRQVHVHAAGGKEAGESVVPATPPEPIRDSHGNVLSAVEPIE